MAPKQYPAAGAQRPRVPQCICMLCLEHILWFEFVLECCSAMGDPAERR